MITKGIILNKLPGDNHYMIRVPILEQAGDINNSRVASILSHTPGIIESYKTDDIVIIGFEEHSPDNPVILGKLYLVDDNEPRGYINVESLNISDSVNLPADTKIDGYSLANIQFFIENASTKLNELDFPKIRVTSLVDTSEYLKHLYVVVSGRVQKGDEIVICERTLSTRRIGTKQYRKYRYKTLKSVEIENTSLKMVTIPLNINPEDDNDLDVVTGNNSTSKYYPVERFVRLRRKIYKKVGNNLRIANALFSNIVRIVFVYSDTYETLTMH